MEVGVWVNAYKPTSSPEWFTLSQRMEDPCFCLVISQQQLLTLWHWVSPSSLPPPPFFHIAPPLRVFLFMVSHRKIFCRNEFFFQYHLSRPTLSLFLTAVTPPDAIPGHSELWSLTPDKGLSENPTRPFPTDQHSPFRQLCDSTQGHMDTRLLTTAKTNASFAFLMRTNFKPFWHCACYRITQGHASAGWIINVYRFVAPGEIKSHSYPQTFLSPTPTPPDRGEKLADVEKIMQGTSLQFPLVIKLYWQIAMDSH